MRRFSLHLLVSCFAVALAGCNGSNPNGPKPAADRDGISVQATTRPGPRVAHAATHLMFTGKAEEAMNFYASVFKGSGIRRIERYGPGEPGAQGTVKRADFTLGGHDLIFIDSPAKHNFTFTPSMSLFVDCTDRAELERAFEQLSTSGKVLMPLDNYGFSTRFGWLQDRFGVSWQLNLQ